MVKGLWFLWGFFWILSVGAGAAVPRYPDPYYGKVSGEALLTFDYKVRFDDKDTPNEADVKDEIGDQVVHLFGTLAVATDHAVPKSDYQLSQIHLTKVAEGQYEATYHYSGHIVSQQREAGETSLILPIDPDKIWRASLVTAADGTTSYPCITDKHHNEEEDFWYFWNPAQSGCPLQEGIDYARVSGHVVPLGNTSVTYPEYRRLINSKGVIRIDLWFGMDDPSKGRNPFTSTDYGAEGLVKMRTGLLQWGFNERGLPEEEIRQFVGETGEPLPYAMEMWKQEAKAMVDVRMWFGPSAVDEDSKAFHTFLKESLTYASIFIYSGHSGFGDYLDIGKIEKKRGIKLEPNKDRYQIYFFNSCSSYPYYGPMYFERKKSPSDPNGTRNLDILTNGLATYFSIPHDTNAEVVYAVDRWASGEYATSYQEIVNAIDSDNLMGVNGDEDNPTEPDL